MTPLSLYNIPFQESKCLKTYIGPGIPLIFVDELEDVIIWMGLHFHNDTLNTV